MTRPVDGAPSTIPELHECGDGLSVRLEVAFHERVASKSLMHVRERSIQKGAEPVDIIGAVTQSDRGIIMFRSTYDHHVVRDACNDVAMLEMTCTIA